MDIISVSPPTLIKESDLRHRLLFITAVLLSLNWFDLSYSRIPLFSCRSQVDRLPLMKENDDRLEEKKKLTEKDSRWGLHI